MFVSEWRQKSDRPEGEERDDALGSSRLTSSRIRLNVINPIGVRYSLQWAVSKPIGIVSNNGNDLFPVAFVAQLLSGREHKSKRHTTAGEQQLLHKGEILVPEEARGGFGVQWHTLLRETMEPQKTLARWESSSYRLNFTTVYLWWFCEIMK